MEAISAGSSVAHTSSEKPRKTGSFKSFLEAKRIDQEKIREYFLENCSNIPQELRLVIWKIFLGFSNSFQSPSDDLLRDHYSYLKNTLTNVLAFNSDRPEDLNCLIYLLDKGELPLSDIKMNQNHPFGILYKQMLDVLDDQSDFETFYLTSELHDRLVKSLPDMKSKFMSNLPKDVPNRTLILEINIDVLLESGLAGLFRDVKIYHIIWDHFIMGENELLVFTLIGLLEACKEDHLVSMKRGSNFNLVQKLGLDEAKILKKALVYYKKIHSNPAISNMIINYFNLK